MPIYAYGDRRPVIHEDAYVHPDAVVIGSVELGASSSVWPGAVIRADDNRIVVGARTSVQDGSVLHCTPELETIVGDDVTLGHLCHLEGCRVEDEALVGVGAVVLHEAVIGTGSIVGAGAVVRNGQVVPPNSMALGIPAKVREGVVEPGSNRINASSYVRRAAAYPDNLRRLD